jgi:hypothetical protein
VESQVEAGSSPDEDGKGKTRGRWILAVIVIIVVVAVALPNLLFLPLVETDVTDYTIIARACAIDGSSTTCEVSLFGGIEGDYSVTIHVYDDYIVAINKSAKYLNASEIWTFELDFPEVTSEEYTLRISAPTKEVNVSLYEVLTEG